MEVLEVLTGIRRQQRSALLVKDLGHRWMTAMTGSQQQQHSAEVVDVGVRRSAAHHAEDVTGDVVDGEGEACSSVAVLRADDGMCTHQTTTLAGSPRTKASMLSTNWSARPCMASSLAHATCGVRMKSGRPSRAMKG